MKTPATLSLLVALGAVALGGYALSKAPGRDDGAPLRLEAIEERLARLERAAEAQAADADRGPLLEGLEPNRASADTTGEDVVAAEGDTGAASPSAVPSETIAAMVEEAVAKKATQLQAMRNKKPKLELFAKTLGLDERQRDTVAREIVQAQHDIKALLETPSDDGTVFLDELVEIMAHGMARPGEAKERAGKLFARLLSEHVPGSDQTYAARAESVKARLRESFRAGWSARQYAAFEAWQMDPTEVKGIEGSPWAEVETRVVERARELGAE